MAIQFRSLFPLALPGMLALLGWWWFFSRKKDRLSSNDKQVETLKVGPAIKDRLPSEEACPKVLSVPLTVTQPPETEQLSMSKSSTEPPALPRSRQVRRRSESSGSLPSNIDTRSQPCRDDNSKVELSLMGDEAKSIPLGCPLLPKDVPFPFEAAEECKQESALGKTPGRGWLGQCAASGEKARETGGVEGNGDAVLGENVPEEGLLSQECGSEVEKSEIPSLAPWGGGGEEVSNGPPQVAELAKKKEYVVGKLPSSFVEPVHSELVKDEHALVPQVRGSDTWDRDLPREQVKEETLPKNDEIEQAAFQIISQVILEATEEMRATTMGKAMAQVHPTSATRPQELKETCVPAIQETGLGQDPPDPVSTTPGAAASPLAEALPPKTYVSCLSSPLTSPTKDQKPKISAHHISLAPCPSPVTRLRQSLDGASSPGGDDTFVTCMSNNRPSVLSVTSSGPCSDSLSTSGLEDSCTETISSPGGKGITPPLPDSTEPFSNGVLKEEFSDLGTEDGWTMDTEADHSGGSDGNSMDSVDSCCGLTKPDSLENVQASSNPKKVDLIIWEIEVPKHLVGRLIGKQGRYVSFLKQTSGAKIYISTLPYTQNIQICHIEGSQHHVDKALNLIGKKFKELNLTNIYAPPLPSLALPSLPMTSWLMLPDGITVEVIVVNQVNAGHLFVQQHTHPTFHALRSLDQQMYLCYSQPGIPTLPTPVEITVICAAPGADGAWWRAQVVASYEETNEVEIRYVDYGGYKRVKVDVLRQIRSDFVTLPFQGAEVLLDSVVPLSDDEHFSAEADAAMSEMTGNTALLAQVTSYSTNGLPLIQLWSVVGDEVVLINRSLVERGLAQWVDSYYANL
ncbi:A-kinase anchor protein 1, mitochondrial [Peromyscus maniculatus bairdii]|uniref:A-kinase anchor protein 1, mitochondrial n=1 Tax=Peromyscus maniculatus bairdii TaxID=230844 RepID=A0A6I9L2W1_PERMB|nr:A-kinase anchor protein 1, mitochondrial [Peromyscus maniculatus bairdii]XP_015864184.1 A-kinase anchor protein 1, mitochondrial [Peromyscus maniculatus bairdii]XP_015864192.1 A-kinase anchor protein 1, mitochondrial [Peromyscus maniculatus bairdii]